jgi:3-hydroxybutyryl-CoA dehydratase
VGQSAAVKRVFTGLDLQEYTALTGDSVTLPQHAGPARASARLHVPGGLLGGLFSFLLGTRLPGRGTNWLKQRLVFPAQAHAGDSIEARVEIVRLRPEKDLVNLRTVSTLEDGQIVCHGDALVLIKDLEPA